MGILSKIFTKEAKGRIIGKLAPYSISVDNCNFIWQRSPAFEIAVKAKLPKLDAFLIITPKTNSIKCDSFIRVFVSLESDEDLLVTFDLKKSDDLNSDVIMVGDKKFPASTVSGVDKTGLKDDRYFHNILVHIGMFKILFELFIGNNNEPSKDRIISDFFNIVNSLKV